MDGSPIPIPQPARDQAVPPPPDSEELDLLQPNKGCWILPNGRVIDIQAEGWNDEQTAFSHGLFVKKRVAFRTRRFHPAADEVAVAERIQQRAREILSENPELNVLMDEDGNENPFVGDIAYNQAAQEHGWIRVKPLTFPTHEPIIYFETFSGTFGPEIVAIVRALRKQGRRVVILAGGALKNHGFWARQQK